MDSFLLHEFEVPGYPGLLVIGSFDHKTSLYYQQVRALNLIWLLESAGKLMDQPEICILGGGIAGVTAAAGLLARGQRRMTLLEKGPELLVLQAHSRRPIHPHIYSWPEAQAENPRAGLPLLDWQAGCSSTVATAWIREFTALSQRARIQVLCEASATALESVRQGDDNRFRVTWQSAGQSYEQNFDLVILALGVGIERTVPGLPLHSYWEDDTLLNQPGHILVSGCGEGGLLEVLRLRLQAFRPEEMVACLVEQVELKAQLLEWEAESTRVLDPAAFLTHAYLGLELPRLDQQIQALRIPDLEVTLHGPHNDSPLNPQATILNRLLVSRLLKMGDIKYLGGTKLLEVKPNQGHWLACFSDASCLEYQAILIRHGASSVMKKNFTTLWQLAQQKTLNGTSAQLLNSLWPDHFYQLRKE